MSYRIKSETFIPDVYHRCAGQYVLWKDFLADFYAVVRTDTHIKTPPEELWPEERIIYEMLGVYHPVGRGPRNKKIIGNLSKVFYRPPCWELNDKGKVRLQKTAPGWH